VGEEIHPDLFGGETPLSKPKTVFRETAMQAWVRTTHYRKAETKEVRCSTCIHSARFKQSKRWYKCELLGGGSEATDIRMGHVCDLWKGSE